MELTPKQQTVELVRKASRILLIARPSSDGDSLGSLTGLGLTLIKLGKEVALVSPDPVPPSLTFLPGLPQVTQQFAGTRDLMISVDLAQTPVEKIGYRKSPEGKSLDILVTPKSGIIPEKAVTIKQSSFRFDLVIILDTPDLEQLGSIYDAHTQLFFETPVINIDHHAGNDHFGKVNWVDLTATSTAEILVSFIESLAAGQSLWDPDIATALLTGLVWDTQSFQSETTTPKSLTVAAQLIALGARQQEIVKSLFKTKALSTLKLWGVILAGLRAEEEHRLLWAEVTKSELARTEANIGDVNGLADDLIRNAPGQDLAVIFVEEKPENIAVLLFGLKRNIDVTQIAERLGGKGGTPSTPLMVAAPLPVARQTVLSEIRAFQRERMGERPPLA